MKFISQHDNYRNLIEKKLLGTPLDFSLLTKAIKVTLERNLLVENK